MFYFVKTPWLVKKLYPYAIWDIPTTSKTVYITFDDGPHPAITPFVLEELEKYNAKATFFCIGKNVVENQSIYEKTIQQLHGVGNHTQDHLNGWQTSDEVYINNIVAAKQSIDSNLFRPPYGRMKKSQVGLLRKQYPAMKIIMWDVLSADFDTSIAGEQCINNIVKNSRPGSILVFHDSEKAFPRLQKTLPVVLKLLSAKGFVFDKIPENLS